MRSAHAHTAHNTNRRPYTHARSCLGFHPFHTTSSFRCAYYGTPLCSPCVHAHQPRSNSAPRWLLFACVFRFAFVRLDMFEVLVGLVATHAQTDRKPLGPYSASLSTVAAISQSMAEMSICVSCLRTCESWIGGIYSGALFNAQEQHTDTDTDKCAPHTLRPCNNTTYESNAANDPAFGILVLFIEQQNILEQKSIDPPSLNRPFVAPLSLIIPWSCMGINVRTGMGCTAFSLSPESSQIGNVF